MNDSLRIVVHGQQAFGRAVLERLLKQGETIVAVCTAPDKPGRPDDPLKELAQAHNLPVHQPASWRTPEAQELMQSFDADLCMMAYVLLFVPQAVLDAPRLGSFQYHPSLLPMHRGPSSINWPIAQGALETGLSIFWPNEGLDEGDLLLQKTCTIEPDDTLGDVYFNKLFPQGVDAMVEALALVKAGNPPRIKQDLAAGSYESWFGAAQAKINWQRPVSEVYNLIRAANPQPGAWTPRNGKPLKIYDAKLSTAVGTPGQVIAIDDQGFTVSAAGGSIVIHRVRADQGKTPAADYAKSVGLEIGQFIMDTEI